MKSTFKTINIKVIDTENRVVAAGGKGGGEMVKCLFLTLNELNKNQF